MEEMCTVGALIKVFTEMQDKYGIDVPVFLIDNEDNLSAVTGHGVMGEEEKITCVVILSQSLNLKLPKKAETSEKIITLNNTIQGI